jgi:hypothetical protein
MNHGRMVFSFLVLSVFLLGAHAEAANYTVKAGGGASYPTIQACASAAAAGDTCTVFAGNYNETVNISKSGSQGNPITFQANPGDTVTVQGWNLGSSSWIVIGGSAANTGFEVTNGPGFTWTAMNHVVIQNNNVHHTSGRCFQGPNGSGSGAATYNSILNNTVTYCGNGQAQGFIVEGNHWLISGNTISHVEDGIALYGDHHVIRGNKFGPVLQSEYGSQHPDALESSCAGDFPLTRMVFEGNTIVDWGQSDAHIFLLRDTNSCGQSDQIIRFNAAADIGSYFAANDTNSHNVRIYNNSVSNTQSSSSSKDFTDITFTNGDTGAKVINNIFADMTRTNSVDWCIYYDPSSAAGFVEHNNLCYITGYTGAWKGPASTANAVTSLLDFFNKDPQFVDPMSDLHIQAGSAAIGAGGSLTNAATAGSGSTSLTVADAGFFQDGYGISGVQPDWIRIGAATTVQIASVNYSTNAITLANAASWSANDPIYLYKDSKGAVVLNGARPDLGAYQVGGGQTSTPPDPPTNLKVIIN